MFPNRFLGRCPSHGLWGLLRPLCFGEASTQLHCVPDTSHMLFLFQPSRLVSIIFFKTCTLPACSKSSDWCCPWARKFVFHLKYTGSLNAHLDKPCKIKVFTVTFSCLSYFFKPFNNICFTENKRWERPPSPQTLALHSYSCSGCCGAGLRGCCPTGCPPRWGWRLGSPALAHPSLRRWPRLLRARGPGRRPWGWSRGLGSSPGSASSAPW